MKEYKSDISFSLFKYCAHNTSSEQTRTFLPIFSKFRYNVNFWVLRHCWKSADLPEAEFLDLIGTKVLKGQ